MSTAVASTRRRTGTGRTRRSGLLIRPVVLVVMLLALWLWVQGQSLQPLEARNLTGDVIVRQLLEMLRLAGICTAITIVIAIPLGIAITLSRSRVARLIGLGLGNL
ncbi:MAG: hypothetical protein ACRDQB_03990, partial [Thermocrispum sp.]